MAIPKLSTILIGLLFVGFFAAGYGLFFTEMNNNYNIGTGSIDEFNILNNLSSSTDIIKQNIESIKAPDNPLDYLGALFNTGYQTLIKLPSVAVDNLFKLINLGVSKLNIGVGGDILYTTLIAIVIILIFVGIILSTLLKREL